MLKLDKIKVIIASLMTALGLYLPAAIAVSEHGANLSVKPSPKEIVIAADLWCPYNCDPQAELPGYMVEIARRAFALESANGYRLSYQVLPWSRAIVAAKAGAIDGIVGAVASEAEGLHIGEEILGISRSMVFALNDSSWRYRGTADLKRSDRRLGIIAGYDYNVDFERFSRANKRNFFVSTGEDPLPELLRLLTAKRIDGVVEDSHVFRYRVRSLNGNEADYREVGEVGYSEKLYIAFNDPALAQVLDRGLRQLRASGELNKILAKYFLQDWQSPSTTK